MLGLLGLRNQHIDVHIVNLVKTKGLNADDVLLVRGDNGHHIQIDRTRQHNAVVVVGVVAADFRAAGGGVEPYRAVGAVLLFKFRNQVRIALALLLHGVRTVQFGKGSVINALRNLLLEFRCVCHNSTRLSCRDSSFRRYAQIEPCVFGQAVKKAAACGFLVFSIANPEKKANLFSVSFMDF